ncbi:MAG: hypothetical protein SCH71_07275 [Desulfobulbaceae bacterium]|nr:hypothetical protein [Desulfobulbaceae bacterium]
MKGKSALHVVIIILVTLILLELTSLLLFNSVTGRKFSYADTQAARQERIDSINTDLGGGGERKKALYMFHPYTGYVGNPGAYPWGEKSPPFNNFGMMSISYHPYPYIKKKDEYVVAILGGSVAEMFANGSEEQFSRFIRDRLGFNKKVIFINLATGGYKQPQQLFHLQYALLSGFELDAVLNIDGFNEIALVSQNLIDDTNPVFPSVFHMALMSQMNRTSIPDKDLAELLVEYYEIYEHERLLLSFVDSRFGRYSIFLNLLGELWTGRNMNTIKKLRYRMVSVSSEKVSTVFSGPHVPLKKNKYETAAEIWLKSSEMLYAVCQENNLLYIHVLQPNQYVEGSKRLSANEEKIAINENNVWGVAAREGYGNLIAHGEVLKKKHIPFYDFTMIYKDVEEDIYIDDCCHMNSVGNLIMSKKIAHILLEEENRRESVDREK